MWIVFKGVLLGTLFTLVACQSSDRHVGSLLFYKSPTQETISTLERVQQLKDVLLYSRKLNKVTDIEGWVMEGPGKTSFESNTMVMHSPNQEMHHVLWVDKTFPDTFIAQWRAKVLDFDSGLAIVFFATQGLNGEDIFNRHLPKRDGTFSQYTKGKIKSYHISYYANAVHNPNRGYANLRKNNTFSLLQTGAEGIPTYSMETHLITLLKRKDHIQMFINDREVISYIDDDPVVDGLDTGDYLREGRIGFRQMQWTTMAYSDFEVWSVKDS